MKKHCLHSPSSMSKARQCPGSVWLAKGMRRQSTIWSGEGDEAHAELERCLTSGDPPQSLDVEVNYAVGRFLSFVSELYEWFDMVFAEGVEQFVESPTIQDFGGTPDYWVVGEKDGRIILVVVDFKYGVGVEVEAEDNDQLTSYLILVRECFAQKFVVDEFYGVVVQPRLWKEPKESSFFESDFEDLKGLIAELPFRENEFNLGPHCQFCPCKLNCPEFHDVVDIVVRGRRIRTKDYIKVLMAAPLMKAAVEQIKEHLRPRLQRGELVPGVKLVNGKSSRVWIDSDVVSKLSEEFGLSEEQLTETKVRSPAQLEKDFPQLKKAFEPHWKKTHSGQTVALAHDRRKPVKLEWKEILTNGRSLHNSRR